VGNGAGQHPENDHVRGGNQQQTPNDGTLAQSGGGVLQLVQAGAAGDESIDGPAGKAEQPQFFAGRRIDGQPVGVVGIPLGCPHFLVIAVAPHSALT
jgi:hypothetical protein